MALAMRQRAARENVAQALAFEQLRNHEGRAVMLPDIVNTENVGMIERSDGASLLLETPQAVGIGGERGGQNFDGDIASQTLIAGAINLAHAARADQRNEFVGS